MILNCFRDEAPCHSHLGYREMSKIPLFNQSRSQVSRVSNLPRYSILWNWSLWSWRGLKTSGWTHQSVKEIANPYDEADRLQYTYDFINWLYWASCISPCGRMSWEWLLSNSDPYYLSLLLILRHRPIKLYQIRHWSSMQRRHHVHPMNETNQQ